MQDLCLNRNIQSRCRLICDQNLRIAAHSHGDHHTLAHTAGKFVGIAAHCFLRVCDADSCEKLQHTGFCLFFVHICVTADQLHHLASNCINRIQR